MKQNIEKQNTKHRSTFAVLFYINRHCWALSPS